MIRYGAFSAWKMQMWHMVPSQYSVAFVCLFMRPCGLIGCWRSWWCSFSRAVNGVLVSLKIRSGTFIVVFLAGFGVSVVNASEVKQEEEIIPQVMTIDHVEGKPLVGQDGEPAPVRVRQAQEARCTTDAGSFRPGPVRLTYGNARFPRHKCFERRGTINPGVSGVDALYGGDWSGSVYYETSTQCVALPFKPRQTVSIDNAKICILDIA